MQQTLEAIDEAIAPLSQAKMARPDAALIRAEYHNTARILRHAVKRMALAMDGSDALSRDLAADLEGYIEDYKTLWLARARPGGLERQRRTV